MKTIKSLEESGLSIKGVSETIKNEAKEQKRKFVSMLLGTLDASLFGSLLASKGNYYIGVILYTFFWWYCLRFRVSFQRSSRTLYFGRTFPASEYLFSAPRGLKKSITSTRFCSLSSRYLEYLRN